MLENTSWGEGAQRTIQFLIPKVQIHVHGYCYDAALEFYYYNIICTLRECKFLGNI